MIGGGVSQRERARLARRLADLIGGGVTIPRGIELLAFQAGAAPVKRALNAVSAALMRGESVSDAFAGAPSLFSPALIGLVRTGEASGRIDAALADMASFLEAEAEIGQRIRAALVYPAFLFALTLAVTAFLFFFVIPGFERMFADLGQALPWPTRLVVGLAGSVRPDGLLLGTAILAAVLWARPSVAAVAADRVARAPILGPVIQRDRMGRFARGMATFLKGGLEIPEALTTCAELFRGEYQRRLMAVAVRLSDGVAFSEAVREQGALSSEAIEMIAAAEEHGELDETLARVAAIARADVDDRIRVALSLLEPALVVLMGLMVGFAALAMVLPIFDISATLK